MTPERLHRIEELYHAARTKDPGLRAAYLTEACGADDELRREVESLLNQPDALATAPTVEPPRASFFFEDLIGRQFGKFRVVSLLRDGGMARVYKGYQESVDRLVAIKVLPRQYASDPRFVERFKQEAHIVAKLHHPHILSVFDHGESDGYTYLTMPFVESGTLADLLARGRLSFGETARIIGQVADALDYAHGQGIVHRDIKPSNILMDAQRNAFVADFGIATILNSARHLTQTGAFLASPGYCSPEQLKGGDVGPHSDLYSVGMVLYEMLTGTAPFELDGSLASILKRADSTLPSPHVRNAGITPQLEAVIVRALAPNKRERFATGREMVAALSAAIQAGDAKETVPVAVADAPPPAPHVDVTKTVKTDGAGDMRPATRRGIGLPVWLAAAAALVMVAWLGATMTRHAEPSAPPSAQTTDAPAPPASAQPSNPAPSAGRANADAANAEPRTAPAPVKNANTTNPSPNSTPAAVRDAAARGPEGLNAKRLYDAPATGATSALGLKYRLIAQHGSNEVDVDPGTTFHSGDKVRFAFESNIEGYLYVVQAGSTGRWTVLFPNPDANGGMNAVSRSSEYLVPDNGWFAFDDTPGTEEVFVVLSKQALDTLPGFKAPVTKRESVDRAVVVGLQASLPSRDLVFEKDRSTAADGKLRQATYIVNRGELASQVAALVQLTHAK